MDIKKLQTVVYNALEDVKAQDIKVFDTTPLTSLFDRLVIASGTSNRQTKALAASVRDKVKENGGDIVGIEGEGTGEWVLVDLGDIIVHIMQPAIRAYYRLEEIWGDKEVKMGAAKRATSATRTAKAAAAKDTDEADAAKPKRHTRAKAAPSIVTPDMMAIQTTVDDDEKKPARKPRTAKATTSTAGSAGAASVGEKKPRTKIPTGARVKVASSKTAVASAKQAATKRATRKKTAD